MTGKRPRPKNLIASNGPDSGAQSTVDSKAPI